MPRMLNVALAWIATAIGAAEILFYLPRTLLVMICVTAIALITWALLHRFGVSQRKVERDTERRRRELGY